MDFGKIIERIKGVKGVAADHEVAKLLNISKNSLSNYKSRDKVPYANLVNFCIKESIDVNYILTGRKNVYEDGKCVSPESYAPTEDGKLFSDVLDFEDYRSKLKWAKKEVAKTKTERRQEARRREDRNRMEKTIWAETFRFLSYILHTGDLFEIKLVHDNLRNFARMIQARRQSTDQNQEEAKE